MERDNPLDDLTDDELLVLFKSVDAVVALHPRFSRCSASSFLAR